MSDLVVSVQAVSCVFVRVKCSTLSPSGFRFKFLTAQVKWMTDFDKKVRGKER